jgi:hypothetical protein
MNYKTTYRRNPGGAGAAKLSKYVSRGPNGMADGSATVADSRGHELKFEDVEGFQASAAESEMSRQHCFAFADEHDPDALIEATTDALDGELDGNYIVACHTDTENPHIHVAEAGAESDLYMKPQDIGSVRSSVADATGESIGEGVK